MKPKQLQILLTLLTMSVIMLTGGCNKSGNYTGRHGDLGSDSLDNPVESVISTINFQDTAALRNSEVMGQYIMKITAAIKMTDSIKAHKSLAGVFDRMRKDEKTLLSATETMEMVLDYPSVPTRDERIYRILLEALLSVDSIPEYIRMRETEHLRRVKMNLPGTIANNFRYLTTDGYETSLHSFRAERTLLIFYDMECDHCKEILGALAVDADINQEIASGQIAVLAIYTEGNKTLWEKTYHKMPTNWHIGYDLTGIADNDLYDLRALPTIYLLDRNKTILRKDLRYGAGA